MNLDLDLDLHIERTSLGGLDFDLDLDAFSDGKTSEISNRYVLPKMHRKIQAQAVRHKHAIEFIEDVGDKILAGQTVHALLSGNFIYGEIFEALAVQKNILIDDLTISTLSISQENIDSLHNLIVGDYVGQLNLIISNMYWSLNRQNAPYIYDALDIDNKFQLAVAGLHTKITLLKIGDKKIVAKGSANLRSSGSIEEVTFETCDELYDFHMGWHREILDEYSTIKKSIFGSKLHGLIIKNTDFRKSWTKGE